MENCLCHTILQSWTIDSGINGTHKFTRLFSSHRWSGGFLHMPRILPSNILMTPLFVARQKKLISSYEAPCWCSCPAAEFRYFAFPSKCRVPMTQYILLSIMCRMYESVWLQIRWKWSVQWSSHRYRRTGNWNSIFQLLLKIVGHFSCRGT